MDKLKPNPSSMRVLIRPPPSPLPTPTPTPTPTTLPDPSPSLPGGVTVVGFVGKRYGDVSQLINRIIDSNVFGSANFDNPFGVGISEEVKNWFERRRISYYHEAEKGILYLQFSSTRCPVMEMEGFIDFQLGFDSALEETEFGDLQGLLFMFSVCHVIIFIQEGSRFDIQILKKFRVLQAAKHAISPLVRSRTTPPLTSRPHSSSSRASPNNRSPGKSGGISSRNASAITLMSGLGSYTSLFPGQCTPVTLFVFLDDFSDISLGNNMDESIDTSSNQTSSLNNIARPSLPMKGSGSVVVLSRPVSKSEGGLRKKLQSSLEAQIRFSIKKCRTLTGSETGHSGSRSGAVSSSAPLFSLDASKAVALVDRSSNRGGESLEFATELVENVLNGTATSDSLLLESHSQSANKEDVLSVKEFIWRQADILRGRGGMVANSNSGSAAGVGMVAVAAAAAAASAASGKTFSTPELPGLETWLSSSQLILHGILSAKRGFVYEPEISKRKGNISKGTDPLEIAVSYLENGTGLTAKFSTLWCQRALPVAKDVYLNDLPACYPTSQHEAHLEKALCAFKSMVKGPAVQVFFKKLEDECTSIWTSGRQLCDAISLTGKPCMHQRHEIKPHSSGFAFLHACACGRSRRLRSDPFDFETANIISNCYPDCDKILPALQLPKGSTAGPIQPSSWSLIRVGGARYYEPSRGLLQSGFCATQKFLLKWKIFLQKQTNPNSSPPIALQQVSTNRSSSKPNVESVEDTNTKQANAAELYPGEIQNGVEFNGNLQLENVKSNNRRINFGRGIPNFTMRKPFSEVVAGPAAADSGFPPLQSRKQPSLASEKGIKQNNTGDKGADQVHKIAEQQESQKVEDTSADREIVDENDNMDSDPSLHIGRNLVPVSMNSGEKIKSSTSLNHVIMYVGFEHECPCGHRFILTPEHLSELGSPYAAREEPHIQSSVQNSDCKVIDHSKFGKNGGHGKISRHSNGIITTAVSKLRNSGKSKERASNGNQRLDALVQFSRSMKGQNDTSAIDDSMKGAEASLQRISLDDGGCAFSLLNRSLPIYMNCPHCKVSKNKNDRPNVKFAGTISQLQRIFLVTPAFPLILATCPIIQFEESCLPQSVTNRVQKLQFSFGCPVILPPESFLSLRLPFVYGVQLDDGSPHPLKPFEHQPELTAWIIKSTTLQVMSKGSNPDEILFT